MIFVMLFGIPSGRNDFTLGADISDLSYKRGLQYSYHPAHTPLAFSRDWPFRRIHCPTSSHHSTQSSDLGNVLIARDDR